jgi:hypothetical protein
VERFYRAIGAFCVRFAPGASLNVREQPLAVSDENSRSKVRNARGDSSPLGFPLQRPRPAPSRGLTTNSRRTTCYPLVFGVKLRRDRAERPITSMPVLRPRTVSSSRPAAQG